MGGPALEELWVRQGELPSTVRPPRAWRSCRSLLCRRAFELGGPVSQLRQLFRRTHDWFVRPLPAPSPLVSLSLSFHIRAHKIYWCLCSRTGSDPSVSSILEPSSWGCWRPGPSNSGITLLPAAGWGHAAGRHSLPVPSMISALTLSGNLNSPPNSPLPISSIIWSIPDLGPRCGGQDSIQVGYRLAAPAREIGSCQTCWP